MTWSKDIPRTNYAMPPDKTPVLIRIPYFDNISPKDIRVLSRHFTQRNFATGDVICNEHDASMDHCFHVITKGTVSICVSEVLLRCLRHGDFFGECALVHMEDLVPVTATALSPASVLSISRDSFESFSESISSLASEVHAAHAIGGFLPPPITLRNLPLFEHMDELKLQQLALLFTVVRFESGKPIYLQDDDSDGFYIISKGTVSLEWSSPDQTPVLLDTLQADAWFGELGLESHSRRLCSAIAVQQCFLLYLSADVFRKFIKLAPELRQSEHFRRVRQSRTISMLKAIPFFHPLIIKEVGPLVRFDESKMVLLSQMFHYKTFRASDFIYREGEMGTSFYLLVLGEAEMSVSRPQDAQQVVLDTLRAGDFFGEINLLEGSTLCPSSVIATQDCTCLKLDHVHFERFFKIAPQLRIPIRNAILARTASSLRHIPFFGGEIVENKVCMFAPSTFNLIISPGVNFPF